MTVVYPEGVPILGNTKVVATLAVASLTAPSLATDINAASSVDLSCYLLPDGWNPTGTQGKGTRQRRLCSKATQERLNTVAWSGPTLRYIHDPQGADADPGNEARELLQEDLTVYFIERMGLDAQDDPFTATERVRVHYLRLGAQIPSGDRTDENGDFFIMQETEYVNEGPVDGVVAA